MPANLECTLISPYIPPAHAADLSLRGRPAHTAYDLGDEPLMTVETLEFLLLLSGWIVAFLLGRELQTGYRQWRLRTAEQRARQED